VVPLNRYSRTFDYCIALWKPLQALTNYQVYRLRTTPPFNTAWSGLIGLRSCRILIVRYIAFKATFKALFQNTPKAGIRQSTMTPNNPTADFDLGWQKMKRLGLIGGTSWHSTIQYYRIINQAVNDHFGNNTNPPLLLANLNQAHIHRLQIENNWRGVADLIIDAAKRLQDAGAEAILFCANTPHKCYDVVSQSIDIPILHIADTTRDAIQARGLTSVCFIGTKFSMQEDFVKQRIASNGIEVLVPTETNTLDELHRIIQRELTFDRIVPESKQYVIDTIEAMVRRGAQGVILGCTEFPLMIKPNDLNIPIFDTTTIHATAASEFTLNSAG